MFHGFSPETMDFLWGIRMNNERDWFLAHKHEYTQYLYEPMKALGNEVFQPFQEVPGLELKVSRIYRDARMHPATPYKESLWFCIRRHVEIWGQHPALFFELRPEGASYGFLLWQPRPDCHGAISPGSGRPARLLPGAAEKGPGRLRTAADGGTVPAAEALPGSRIGPLLQLEKRPGGSCRGAGRPGAVFSGPGRSGSGCIGGVVAGQYLF